MKDDFPAVSEALVKKLEELFPNRVDTIMSLEDLFLTKGRVGVVQYIRHQYEKQQKKSNVLQQPT